MASNITTEDLPFFETIWAANTAIGLNNIIVGLVIAGINGGFSAVLLVPIITSAGCALGNGLGFYVFRVYPPAPAVNRAVASVVSDIAWMFQEAGLPFYGYAILAPILHGAERVLFFTLFWGLIFVIVTVRIAITVIDALFVLIDNPSTAAMVQHSTLVNRLHLGYFVPIALAEIVSAVFLLKRFRTTFRSSNSQGLRGGKLYRYLMRSTEIRLASLAFIGITRSITFSFHMAMGPLGAVSQIDQFVYTLGSLFPFIMYVDILVSRLIFAENSAGRITVGSVAVVDNAATSLHHSTSQKAAGEQHDIELFAESLTERNSQVSGGNSAVTETDVSASGKGDSTCGWGHHQKDEAQDA